MSSIQNYLKLSIFTGYESIVLYYDPLSKKESMEWRKPGKAHPERSQFVGIFKGFCPLTLRKGIQMRTSFRDTIKQKIRRILARGVRLLQIYLCIQYLLKTAEKKCCVHGNPSPTIFQPTSNDYYLFSK